MTNGRQSAAYATHRAGRARADGRRLRLALPVLALLCALPWPTPASAGPVVRVGLYQNQPKVFRDAAGHPAGIFVDLVEQVAAAEGWRLVYVPGTWSEGLARLQSGEIDLMPDVAYTAERGRRFAFHRVPVLNSWSQVYARPGSAIRSILDLDGKRVAVLEGSVQQGAFARFAAGFGLRVDLRSVSDYDGMFGLVARGEADAGVTNRFFGLAHARRHGLEETPVMFDPSDLFFAASPGDPRRLLSALDRHLTLLKKRPDSAYYGSLRRWISEEVRFQLPPWMRTLGLAVLVALIASVAGSALLKRQVDRRTRELAQVNREMESRIVERTEELAAAMERARESDRLKSAFLAAMSHELRTPLNSIIGFTGILLQGLAGPLNGEQRKQMGMVQASARHLLALINDVLDLSKIEAGAIDLAPEPFDPREAVEKAARLVAPLAAKAGLALRTELPAEGMALVADRRRLEQVLINLLNNAVKFTERGEVAVVLAPEGDGLRVAVSDTGIGIRPEEMANLFRPFHQLDSGLARRREGTGLGLSICRKLAARMGGSLEVESRYGEGSVFTLRLPASPPPVP